MTDSSQPLKFLTIRQPWASLIAVGAKTIETRPFSTKYRGPLAVHAGKTRPAFPVDSLWRCDPDQWAEDAEDAEHLRLAGWGLDRGEPAFVVTDQLPFGDFTPGRYAWLLDNIRPIDPVPMKGAQGLRDLPAEIVERVA